jgi:hypothetical protein
VFENKFHGHKPVGIGSCSKLYDEVILNVLDICTCNKFVDHVKETVWIQNVQDAVEMRYR